MPLFKTRKSGFELPDPSLNLQLLKTPHNEQLNAVIIELNI